MAGALREGRARSAAEVAAVASPSVVVWYLSLDPLAAGEPRHSRHGELRRALHQADDDDPRGEELRRVRDSVSESAGKSSELTMMLDKISSVLPSIEAAQPGCKAGIHELCSLYNIVEKGKLITQHCTECSKLYLASTGEAILARCERIRDSLRRSLFLIQNMVPPVLANQIAEVPNDLQDVKFVVDPLEEEAGKIILEMLQQPDANEELELETFRQAASKLKMTSPKAMLIERRAIKKLLDKISGTDTKKEGVLKFFLYLVEKYGKNIKSETGERNENLQAESQSSTPSISFVSDASPPGKFYTPTEFERYEYENSMSRETTPPAEFCCPISRKLMHDPVIITSGQLAQYQESQLR